MSSMEFWWVDSMKRVISNAGHKHGKTNLVLRPPLAGFVQYNTQRTRWEGLGTRVE